LKHLSNTTPKYFIFGSAFKNNGDEKLHFYAVLFISPYKIAS